MLGSGIRSSDLIPQRLFFLEAGVHVCRGRSPVLVDAETYPRNFSVQAKAKNFG
jgi:hypothetical protein